MNSASSISVIVRNDRRFAGIVSTGLNGMARARAASRQGYAIRRAGGMRCALRGRLLRRAGAALPCASFCPGDRPRMREHSPARFETMRASRSRARMPGWYAAGLAFSLLMLLVHAAAGLNTAGVPDFWRDVYWA